MLAERTLRPTDPVPFPGADAVACELAREAIYWALLAFREQSAAGARGSSETSSTAREQSGLRTLWSETPADLLDRAAEGPEPLERLRADLLDQSFLEFAELSPSDKPSPPRVYAHLRNA